MQKYTFALKPITAVHIGTGDVISPLEYAIGKIEQKDILFTFNPEKLIALFKKDELDYFNNLVNQNKIIELRDFISKKAKSKEYIQECIDYIARISEEFKKKYEETKDDINNALEIATTYKANKRIIIPGSSIKGAIRTAVLNILARQVQAADAFSQEGKNEKIILKYHDAKNDPFRAISLSDVSFDLRDNLLVSPMTPVFYNSEKSPEGVNIYAEVLKGNLLGNNISETGEIAIHDKILNKRVQINENKSFYIEEREYHIISKLAEYINEFYKSVFIKEYTKVTNGTMNDSIKVIYDQIANYINTDMKNNNKILIRIGRWSHVEAVTIENFRRPFNRRGYGKTRTLIQYNGGFYPMGWCAMKINL